MRLLCGCEIQVNHDSGDRRYDCIHNRTWIIRASSRMEVNYSIEERIEPKSETDDGG